MSYEMFEWAFVFVAVVQYTIRLPMSADESELPLIFGYHCPCIDITP